MKIKFPTGRIAHEIFHYMGAGDGGHYDERPEDVRNLIDKLLGMQGKIVDLTDDETALLAKEVDYALDIKQDHISTYNRKYDWLPVHHYHLRRFYQKLINQ